MLSVIHLALLIRHGSFAVIYFAVVHVALFI